MSISMSDPVGAALRSAHDGLSYRQKVSADDVANADTPDYTAHNVSFEDSLRGALDTAGKTGSASAMAAISDVTPTVSASTAQRGADGNNVDLANESLTAMQATYSYQLLSRAVGDRFGMITTAIGGV